MLKQIKPDTITHNEFDFWFITCVKMLINNIGQYMNSFLLLLKKKNINCTLSYRSLMHRFKYFTFFSTNSSPSLRVLIFSSWIRREAQKSSVCFALRWMSIMILLNFLHCHLQWKYGPGFGVMLLPHLFSLSRWSGSFWRIWQL